MSVFVNLHGGRSFTLREADSIPCTAAHVADVRTPSLSTLESALCMFYVAQGSTPALTVQRQQQGFTLPLFFTLFGVALSLLSRPSARTVFPLQQVQSVYPNGGYCCVLYTRYYNFYGIVLYSTIPYILLAVVVAV